MFILFWGCEQDDSPPAEKIAQMYVDILIAEQTYQFDEDSLGIAVEEVYLKHGITKDIYDDEIRKFETDEEKWNEFFAQAKSYLDSLKKLDQPPDS